MEFLRNLCNGNGTMATERWKLGISFDELQKYYYIDIKLPQ